MHSIKQKTLYKTSMNKIFRFQLLFAFLLVTFIASAQKISFEAGFTNPVRYGNGVSRTFLNGNQLGFSAIIPLKNNFSLLTGALYTVAYNDKLQGYRITSYNVCYTKLLRLYFELRNAIENGQKSIFIKAFQCFRS